jgi:hypothetical protein
LFVEIANILRKQRAKFGSWSVRGAKRAPSGKSSSVAGTANVHTPAQGIPAVAAVIEIALSAQPMAGQTWRRRKDWLSDH